MADDRRDAPGGDWVFMAEAMKASGMAAADIDRAAFNLLVPRKEYWVGARRKYLYHLPKLLAMVQLRSAGRMRETYQHRGRASSSRMMEYTVRLFDGSTVIVQAELEASYDWIKTLAARKHGQPAEEVISMN